MDFVLTDAAADDSVIFLPRDLGAASLVKHFEAETFGCPLVIVKGPSGSGKSDLAGPVFASRLRTTSGKSHPKLVDFDFSDREPVADLAARITDQIIEQHTEFRSRKTSAVFREKIIRTVKRSPSEGAARLRSMIRVTEKSAFDLRKIQLLVHLDGVDRLFENSQLGGDDSRLLELGSPEEPWSFLSLMTGLQTICFVISCRDWAWPQLSELLGKASINEDKRFLLDLPYPEEAEMERIVTKLILPIRENSPGEERSELEQWSSFLCEELKENPAAVSILPEFIRVQFADKEGKLTKGKGCLKRFADMGGIEGFLARKADEAYLEETFGGKLATEDCFTQMIEAPDKRLALRGLSKSPEHWRSAFRYVDEGILSLQGSSLRKAQLNPVHQKFLSTWHRAATWSRDEQAMGLTQLRYFDSKALSWELAERKRALLLQSDEDKAHAESLLKDSELSSKLNPLTHQYLALSMVPKKDLRGVFRKAVLCSSVAMVCLLGMGIFLWILGAPEQGEPSATVESDPAKEIVPDPVPEVAESVVREEFKLIFDSELAMTAHQAMKKVPVGSVPPFLPAASSVYLEFSFDDLVENSAEELQIRVPRDSAYQTMVTIPRANSGDGPRENESLLNTTDSWSSLINSMGLFAIEGQINEALDVVACFHRKSLEYPDQIKRIENSEFRALASHLGKIAVAQKDDAAIKEAWRLELIPDNLTYSTDFRMLMARVALNAGREELAVALLAEGNISGEISSASIQFMKTAVDGHFKEKKKTAFRAIPPLPLAGH